MNGFLCLPPLLSSQPEHQSDWETQQPGIWPDNYHRVMECSRLHPATESFEKMLWYLLSEVSGAEENSLCAVPPRYCRSQSDMKYLNESLLGNEPKPSSFGNA